MNLRRKASNDGLSQGTAPGITHVSMMPPRGRYSVDPHDMDQFWALYGDEYMDGIFGLAEMTGLYIPVLVDIDLKQEYMIFDPDRFSVSDMTQPGNVVQGLDMSTIGSLYDLDFVQRLVKIYQKVLRDILDALPEEDLLCVYMAKKPYPVHKNGRVYIKHGFHLHFPKIYVHRYVQENELLPRVRLELKRCNSVVLPVPVEQALDRTYCRGNSTPWLLYGSRKGEDMDPYLIDSVYDHEGSRVINWRSELLDYVLFNSSDVGNDPSTMVCLSLDNIEFHLPRIFSTRPDGRSKIYVRNLREDLTPIRETLQNHAVRQFCNKNDANMSNMNVVNFPMPVTTYLSPSTGNTDSARDKQVMSWTSHETHVSDIAKDLINILDVHRSIDRNEWIHVGWILYNIFDGNEAGLNLWLVFSQKSPAHYDERSCRYEWSRMVKKNLSMGTLKHIAREDAPDLYNEVMSRYARPYMDKAVQLNGTHHDIALALYQKYEHEFVCASIHDRIWYRFNAPVWSKNEEGVTLRAKISTEIVQDYEAMAKEWLSKGVQGDKDEAKFYQKKVDQIMRLVTRLKNSPFKTNIMKECAEVFYDAHFIRQLDSDPFLIGFQNGVYDLKNMVFRNGRPSDRMSMCMPIVYRDELTMDHPDVHDVVEFLEKIFPDRSVREYFLNISCEVFIGGNSNKIVQFWSGEGDNGKSVTQSLFEKMLGPYSIKLPTSLLVGKRTQSSSACPELARAGNGVRLAMLQEPDQKDVINIGILKELSGNDSFFARGLYKDGCEIQPMFKLVLVCNDPPKLPYNDRATWNRIRVIPFESTFTDEPPDTPEEQLAQKRFPKDKYFTKKIPKMTEAFAWYLLHHLRSRPAHRVEPEKVQLATATYQRRNDVFRQFTDENIVCDESRSLRLVEVYSQFKEWFRESVPQGTIPPKTEFRDYLTKMWGDPKVGAGGGVRWEGKTLLSFNGDSAETDAGASQQYFD